VWHLFTVIFFVILMSCRTDDKLRPMLAALESTEQTGVKDSAERDQYVTSFCTQVTDDFLRFADFDEILHGDRRTSGIRTLTMVLKIETMVYLKTISSKVPRGRQPVSRIQKKLLYFHIVHA